MITLKDYARQAKERMKSGFWQDAKDQLEQQRQVAATVGADVNKATKTTHDLIARMVNKPNSYQEEEMFYNKVVEILTSKTTVTNPLMQLADKEYMESLTPHERQSYIIKLSTRYQKAVERYNSCKRGTK